MNLEQTIPDQPNLTSLECTNACRAVKCLSHFQPKMLAHRLENHSQDKTRHTHHQLLC